jgi:hypothetical protein
MNHNGCLSAPSQVELSATGEVEIAAMRLFWILLSASSLGACALTEADQLERQTVMAEKREKYAFERTACEEASEGAWMCSSGSKKSQEDFPWLHCACTNNWGALR